MIAQYVSGIGIAAYAFMRFPQVRSVWKVSCLRRRRIREIVSFSTLTCVQQSIVNLGILMVQGLVNSFGPIVMAAFAAAVKSTPLPICRCRTSATHFPPLSHRITAQKRAREYARG